jgi:hypothetical protein
MTGKRKAPPVPATGLPKSRFADHSDTHDNGQDDPPEAESRRCPACARTKPTGDFALDPTRKGGRSWRCRSCKSEYDRDRHQRRPEVAWRSSFWKRARLYGLADDAVAESFTKRELLERQAGKCGWPGCQEAPSRLDHRRPIWLGGGHTRANAWLLCAEHEKQKTGRDLREIAAKRAAGRAAGA